MTTPPRQRKAFHCKQFRVEQGQCGMPISTDGILLGAWSGRIESAQQGGALDIGTGTGLLSLMLAQQCPELVIHAIDIDEHAVKTAHDNFQHSPWATRLHAAQQDVLSAQFDRRFERIICNPPYFNSGVSAQNHQRALARHTQSLDHQRLAQKTAELLAEQGLAHFILPANEGLAFTRLMQQQGLHLTRECLVRAEQHKPVTRRLLEFSHQRQTRISETTLNIRHENQYTAAFTELTREFYLKMA